MPGWNPLQYLLLVVLIVLIGIPLWLYEKVVGHQPDGLVDWLDRKLGS
jgi:hypothetical protein